MIIFIRSNSNKNYHNSSNVTTNGSNNGDWSETAPIQKESNFPWLLIVILLCIGGFVIYKYRDRLFNRG